MWIFFLRDSFSILAHPAGSGSDAGTGLKLATNVCHDTFPNIRRLHSRRARRTGSPRIQGLTQQLRQTQKRPRPRPSVRPSVCKQRQVDSVMATFVGNTRGGRVLTAQRAISWQSTPESVSSGMRLLSPVSRIRSTSSIRADRPTVDRSSVPSDRDRVLLTFTTCIISTCSFYCTPARTHIGRKRRFRISLRSVCYVHFGPIPWGHSGPLCHALSLLLSSSSWTSMCRRRATVAAVATPGEWQCKMARSGEWAQHFSNASCLQFR